jgi:protein-S-isoprenylcysteine O-methyltransferase Ste14
MNTARYVLALLLIMMVPGAFLFWFSIHPFVQFWRRVGPRRTLAIHYGLVLLLAGAIFLIRRPLLAVDFGTDPLLVVLSIPLLAVSVALRLVLSRQLKNKTLTGLPELAPEAYRSRLLTEGVYAHVRHPRYLQFLLALLALALFANYLATYILFGLGLVWVFPVTQIEERELRDRFGAEYEAYRARVPRLVPKF